MTFDQALKEKGNYENEIISKGLPMKLFIVPFHPDDRDNYCNAIRAKSVDYFVDNDVLNFSRNGDFRLAYIGNVGHDLAINSYGLPDY